MNPPWLYSTIHNSTRKVIEEQTTAIVGKKALDWVKMGHDWDKMFCRERTLQADWATQQGCHCHSAQHYWMLELY
ncbi:MAG: hypothetical protein BWX73_00685 [Lentisphaerae bacterium ADurb.Bin082]|nr:MAG: hypothetical protein BWX73_00685 [Lentisphaerae bacterium ADurb.Bin082]HQL86390.1 hypothetical protein [Lentisphaeria bacterium]